MTIRNSFKQLFRRPAKVLLFFFLMLAATALLVFGAGLYYQNAWRMEALNNYYTTIATIRQPWESVENGVPQYGEIVRPEDLEFEGADYILPPENRPYLLSYMPDLNPLRYGATSALFNLNVVEFEVLENGDGETPTQAVVTRDLLEGDREELLSSDWYMGAYQSELKLGDEFTLNQSDPWVDARPLEKGKRYIGRLYGRTSDSYHIDDGTSFGRWVSDTLYFYPIAGPEPFQEEGVSPLMEVTGEDFYEPGNPGELWLNMVEQARRQDYTHPVLTATSGTLMPCVRNNSLKIRGRMITEEEFQSGAKVCLIGQGIAQKNVLWEGKTVKLSLLASLYGYTQDTANLAGWANFSSPEGLLDENGMLLEPFWEEEYEIVGIVEPRYGTEEIPFTDMFVIPAKSVQASDEGHVIYYGPMNKGNASFQIPNGTIDSFLEKMNAAIPEVASRVVLDFDDMGYSRAVDSLREAQSTAFLLFLVGLLAAVAIVALLMYFFIVLEKKRTAIERSMGMTKAQCRASLLAGVLAVTLCAALLGSVAAGVMLNQADASAVEVQEEEDNAQTNPSTKDWSLGGVYHFSAKYSPWAMWDVAGNQAQQQAVPVPPWLYLTAPLVLTGLVGLLALVLVNQNLKTEPILLLNTHA